MHVLVDFVRGVRPLWCWVSLHDLFCANGIYVVVISIELDRIILKEYLKFGDDSDLFHFL